MSLAPYIISHYNPSVRIIDLVSHVTYVMCVVLYIGDETYTLISTPKETFHGNFIYSHSFCQKSAERRKSRRKCFFIFCSDVWLGVWTLALCLISQHTNYGTTATAIWHLFSQISMRKLISFRNWMKYQTISLKHKHLFVFFVF